MKRTSLATRIPGRVWSDRLVHALAFALALAGCTGAVPDRDPLSDEAADASKLAPEADASFAPSDAGASDELVTLASGSLPEPLAARRLTYVHRAPCASDEEESSPLTPQSTCCFTDRAETLVSPVGLTVRRRGAAELVCLDAGEGTSSACAPVDASGLATFTNGIALQALYSHWGLLYSALVSDTSLTVRLSSARDHATLDLAVYGRFFVGPGCASGAGSYVPPTRLEVPLARRARLSHAFHASEP